jgi:hypothetical protein
VLGDDFDVEAELEATAAAGLEWLMDRLIAMQTPSRRPLLDYHIHTALPDHILAIIRVSWYTNGKPDCVQRASAVG